MTHRAHNFSAGPAALPLKVLEQAKEELVDFAGSGMSLLEMSHRGKLYESVHDETIENLRRLMGIGENYTVVFMGGGARTQFALVPMNLLGGTGFAQYLVTGTWAEGAYREGKKIGDARELWSSAQEGHCKVPKNADYALDAGAAYLHYTSNNTIYGTQYHEIPEPGDVPLVCDMSSDILSCPIDVSKFGLIYAGAQKNMGPAGVTVLIVRSDLLDRGDESLPEMFSYKKIAAKNSLLNTPPVFAIYMVGLVVKHLLEEGGLAEMQRRNTRKAEMLYEAIDGSGGFYKPHAELDSRSKMNVTFRLATPELEKAFVEAALAQDMHGLKGHRSVGGIRASIYNAVPESSVQALVQLMKDFHAKNG